MSRFPEGKPFESLPIRVEAFSKIFAPHYGIVDRPDQVLEGL